MLFRSAEIEKEATRFNVNNQKLYDMIQQIFYIDPIDDLSPKVYGTLENDTETIEVKFKKAIALVKKENERYEKYLQVILGWLK